MSEVRKQHWQTLEGIEKLFYWIIWTSAVAYGINCVWKIKYDVDFPENYFTTTWLGKRDVTDFEWETWLQNALVAAPYVAVNFLISIFIPSWKALQWWRLTWSCVFLTSAVSPLALMVVLQSVAFHLISVLTSRKIITWAACLVTLVFLNTVTYESILGSSTSYMLGLIQSWVLLRNMSCCLDVQSKKQQPNLLQALAYALYLPLLFSGPVILYNDYVNAANQNYPLRCTGNVKSLVLGLARYLFWGVVLHLWLHEIYANAISFMPWHLYQVPLATAYALVYCLGQYFMLKYTVIYGISGTIARAEGVPTPQPPKCIARVHLYSDMWRVFDPGLYKFLNRYINVPIREWSGSWFLSSISTFAFVYVWHGTAFYIAVWSLLNWLGIVIEKLAQVFVSTRTSQRKNVWSSWRVKAAVATPLLFLSALSNSYFLAGYEAGNIFLLRSLEGSVSSKIVLFFILYSCCHVSQQVKEYELNKIRSQQSKS